MPSEAVMFLPRSKKFITNYPEDVEIERDWLLITRSGSVGRILISNDILKKFVLSDDLIRITPNDKAKFGYLYAYLNTWMGQAFLVKDQYGATVKHIEPHHVAGIPIPWIPRLMERVEEKILNAHKLREDAQSLLIKAEEMLYSKLALPKIDEGEAKYFGNELGRVIKSFEISSSDLDLRLDASYHAPVAQISISNLNKVATGKIIRLGDTAETFVPPRFKRAYVKNPSDGVPLLQGSHVTQIKPQDLKFLWRNMKQLDKYVVKKNWIIVTCSGTIGRLSLVMDFWDGWTATNHLLRIIPDENKIHPGYLTAYLLTSYGQILFQKLIYGGVVDEIGEAGELFNEIPVLKPKDEKIEKHIGNLVFEAYSKRDEANKIEDECTKIIEQEIEKLAA
jgi:type I restriction enzyme S subunit